MSASLSKLEKICAKNPTSILFARLAEGYLQKGQVKRAFEICRQGLRYRPSYVAGHLVMGKCHLVSERFEEARAEFQKVLQLDPDHVATFWYLGQIDLKMGWDDLALQNFECAFVLDPFNQELADQIKSLQNEGSALEGDVREEGDSKDKNDDSAVESDEVESDEIDQGLTTLVREMGQTQGEKAPGKEIVRPVATVTLAELYVQQGLVRQAVDTLERVLEKEPENRQARDRLETLRS